MKTAVPGVVLVTMALMHGARGDGDDDETSKGTEAVANGTQIDAESHRGLIIEVHVTRKTRAFPAAERIRRQVLGRARPSITFTCPCQTDALL